MANLKDCEYCANAKQIGLRSEIINLINTIMKKLVLGTATLKGEVLTRKQLKTVMGGNGSNRGSAHVDCTDDFPCVHAGDRCYDGTYCVERLCVDKQIHLYCLGQFPALS